MKLKFCHNLHTLMSLQTFHLSSTHKMKTF